MFTINVRKLFRKPCEPKITTSPPRSKPRSTARPSLEVLEDRTLLSASPLALPTAADAPAQMTVKLNQWMQLMAMAEQDLSNAVNLFAQAISFAQQQRVELLSILADDQASALGTVMSPGGSGTAATSQEAPTASAMAAKVKPQGPDVPPVAGPKGYLWDPTNGTNASIATNWDYNGVIQNNPNTAKKPGDTLDPVTFDITATKNLHNAGGSAITWDYSPAKLITTMNVGGLSSYNGIQTINAGVVIDTSVTENAISDFHLNFIDQTSKFQIDGDSTLTTFHLGGSTQGQLLINSGTTTIGQSNAYTELDGASLTVGSGAILSDQSQCSLKFWASTINIKIQGEMDLLGGANTAGILIDINGNTKDYIDVSGNGALLKYSGTTGNKNTFTAPVMVENNGTFQVNGGWLVVQGNVNGTVPNVSNNASVYLTGFASWVELSNSATLECDSDYYQDDGELTTTDTTPCTLQDGPTGALGTATITADGILAIYNPLGGRQAGNYGFLNINCSQLNFNGKYSAHIAGNASGPLTNDVLTLPTGTLNLQGGSALIISVDNPPPAGQQFSWTIIKAGRFLNPQFNTESSNPNTPGLKYGPAQANEYDVSFG